MLGHLTVDSYVGVIPVLYPVLIGRFHLTLATVGLVSLAYSGTAAISQTLFGVIADRYGTRFTGVALAWTALTFALVGFVPGLGGIPSVRRARRTRAAPGVASQLRHVRLRHRRHDRRRARAADRHRPAGLVRPSRNRAAGHPRRRDRRLPALAHARPGAALCRGVEDRHRGWADGAGLCFGDGDRRDDVAQLDRQRLPGVHAHLVPAAWLRPRVLWPARDDTGVGERGRHGRLWIPGGPLRPSHGDPGDIGADHPRHPAVHDVPWAMGVRDRDPDRVPRGIDGAADAFDGSAAHGVSRGPGVRPRDGIGLSDRRSRRPDQRRYRRRRRTAEIADEPGDPGGRHPRPRLAPAQGEGYGDLLGCGAGNQAGAGRRHIRAVKPRTIAIARAA